MHAYSEYINPYLAKLLKNVKMDKRYTKGEGCYLYDGSGVKYLDFIAAYGALPFGYNHESIWNAVMEFYHSKEPSFIQPSYLEAAGELAERLIRVAPAGLKYVTFTNSGAETVEAAIKLCRSTTGRMGILAAKNSFHGKTLGALSATGKSSYQAAFGAPVNGFHFIEYGSLDSLQKELESNPFYYAAFIVEPIQGEGGIVEPLAGYLRSAKEICNRYGVLLVADEIQTGLGRTGSLFACEQDGVCPDVLLLAKALGGGIIPVGACISTEKAYNEEFAMKHSSTFAGGSLACRVGIQVLDLLTNGTKILDEVNSNGKLLKRGLEVLKEKYPDIIKSVRGRGLMQGIEFCIDTATFPGSMLGIMAENDILTPVISSYLLNREHIRVAPTLNGNNVIRLEPPLIINSEQCYSALEKIENMLKVLSEGNSARFLSFLLGEDDNRKYSSVIFKSKDKVIPPEDAEDSSFAFLVHPLDYGSFSEFDESFSVFGNEELSRFGEIWNGSAGPFVIASMNLSSANGRKAFGEFICILRTADELLKMPKGQAIEEIKAAVRLARNKGAKIVGLGAYTSVISMGGLYLKDEGVPLTTGNSYTVVSAVDAINYAMRKLGSSPENATAAIIGAAGSIGRGISILLSETVSRLVLVGNPGNKDSSLERLYGVAGEIFRHIALLARENNMPKKNSIGYKVLSHRNFPPWDAPIGEFIKFARLMEWEDSPVRISTTLSDVLPSAEIVVCATNSVSKLITRETLKYGAIVCDISRPANVSEDLAVSRPDILVIDGGVVEVPGLPSLGWNFGFEKGLAYACMAETMMLALEHHYTHTSLGSTGVSIESITLTRRLAEKHGFKLAKLRSFNKPLDEERWNDVLRARNTGLLYL